MPQLGSILLLMLLLMSDEEDGESSFRSQLDKVDDLYRTHGVKIVVDSAFSL